MKEKTATTTKDFSVQFKGYALTVPAGSRVSNKTAMGCDDNYRFWQDFQETAEKLTGFKHSMLAHDLDHYGINIPAEYCDSYGA